MADQDGWLTGRKEIADHLGVTGRTVTRMWKKYADFPVRVVDGRFTVKVSTLNEWMQKRPHVCALCGREVDGAST